MLLLLALALDPAPEVTLLARNATHLTVVHPAALWNTPAAEPLRRQFDAVRFAAAYNRARAAAWRRWDDFTLGTTPQAFAEANKRRTARAAGELRLTFPLADGLDALCQLGGLDSPADIVRLTVSSDGFAVAGRRPIDRARLVHEFAGRPGRSADDGATLPERTLAGNPYYRNDELWQGLLFLDGGRTVVFGKPHVLEPAALGEPAAGPLEQAVEQVRAGRTLVAAGVGKDSAALTPAGYRGLCVAADVGDRVTLDAWPLGGPVVADRKAVAAELKGLARKYFAAPIPGANGEWLRAVLGRLDAAAPLPGLRPGFRLTFDRPADLPDPLAAYAGDPAGQPAYPQDKPVTDQPNLRAVTAALLAYAKAHGRFPPAATRSADGKPLLSWRVAILPHLGAEAAKLHAEFKLDQPWDGPHNIALAGRMPAVFRSLANDPAQPLTPFQVFVGRGTAFDSPAGVPLADFPDGLADTALVAEAGRPVPWTKPHDLIVTADQHVGFETTSGLPDLTLWLGFGDGTIGYATAQMQGRWYGEVATPAQNALRAVLTRNGREKLGRRDLLQETTSVRRVLAPAIVPAGGPPR